MNAQQLAEYLSLQLDYTLQEARTLIKTVYGETPEAYEMLRNLASWGAQIQKQIDAKSQPQSAE